jgi:hypothetical protein
VQYIQAQHVHNTRANRALKAGTAQQVLFVDHFHKDTQKKGICPDELITPLTFQTPQAALTHPAHS